MIEQLDLGPLRSSATTLRVLSALIRIVEDLGPLLSVSVRQSKLHRYEIIMNVEAWIVVQKGAISGADNGP